MVSLVTGQSSGYERGSRSGHYYRVETTSPQGVLADPCTAEGSTLAMHKTQEEADDMIEILGGKATS